MRIGHEILIFIDLSMIIALMRFWFEYGSFIKMLDYCKVIWNTGLAFYSNVAFLLL